MGAFAIIMSYFVADRLDSGNAAMISDDENE
jgi:hypothetical protein